jgi:hypothetical protein
MNDFTIERKNQERGLATYVDGDRKQMAFGATVELYALLVNPTCWLYSCASGPVDFSTA